MGNYHLNGIVLQNQDVGERDVITTIFSEERGKARFLVRGTKKLESTLRAAVEPITEGHYFLAERRTLDILSEWEPIEYNMELKRDGSKTALAAYIIRFLLELCPENSPEKALYTLLKNVIYILHTDINHDIMKLIIEWGFLKASGLAPEFGVCASCGQTKSARYYFWDIVEGAFYCDRCAGAGGRSFVKLGLGEIELGKKIEAGTEVLCNKEYASIEAAKSFKSGLAYDARVEGVFLSTYSRATSSFIGYHLREDIPGWHLKH